MPVQPVIVTQRHQSRHASQSRSIQQISDSRSHSLPSTQAHRLSPTQTRSNTNQIPPVAVVPPSPKIIPSSIQITLRKTNGEQSSLSKVQQILSTKSINNESKQIFRPSATILVGGGSRSAFRPFHKSTNVNGQTKVSLNNNNSNNNNNNNTRSQTFQPK